MKKFAFLVHLRDSYQKDLALMSKPLGWIPEGFYRSVMRSRPVSPFLWSDVTLTPGATAPEGHIIMVPYTGRQLLEQQGAMMPQIRAAIDLGASKGAEIVGLGAFTSPITLGGRTLVDTAPISVTNGNAFTAYITWKKVARLIQQSYSNYPTVALVGATGSVGSLLCQLLAKYQPEARYMLVARNERKLRAMANTMHAQHPDCNPIVSQQIDDIKRADIVVLLTSAADSVLKAEHLKAGAVVLDDTMPRNTHPELVSQRPDVIVYDGGLVAMKHLRMNCSIGLAPGISYACLAETMLLAQAGHEGHFSVGNPTLEQAEYISKLAQQYAHLGFDLAPDYSFGKRLPQSVNTYDDSSVTTSLVPAF
ncbi:polysaccharide biosynthesis protein [Spirosoma rhododendri]|uniref:Polysaccharide biosynthesis protein n=1 Tax=Spirosoma rhododendri TaxID=2728024 RepID=A0A7L5DU88_9BACT|nr:polysaccharide biosynthesis protein [Spirosoma rhododendri]QJD80158.1 polysaccharide biosynthesis protein [Spirosoma rhododendri]